MNAPPIPHWLELRRGQAPLLLSLPHTGITLPEEIQPSLRSLPQAQYDADWHVHRLYDFAVELDATIIRTDLSRTVIDVNRDPSGVSLYPGQFTTGLCPLVSFDGTPLYRDGREPDAAEIARRRETYFEPYHAALRAELARLRARHPQVLLYDAHSIRAVVPSLFDGRLPDFNVGTNDGHSCDPALTATLVAQIDVPPWTHVLNGRFKGGWITRHYADPAHGVHAIQMELAQHGYMDEATSLDHPRYEPARAAAMRALLQAALTALLARLQSGEN